VSLFSHTLRVRRSGVTRTNGLVYAPDGADCLVVASKGGADQPPTWLLNLKAKLDLVDWVTYKKQTGVDVGSVTESA
jgi:hypothetical protein